MSGSAREISALELFADFANLAGRMERLAIVGPGAMGLLFSYFLEPVFPELVLIDQFKNRSRILNEQGIRVRSASGVKRRKVRASVNPREVGPVDLVLICVKAYDTRSAMENAQPLLGRNTLVLTLQNGLGNLETIAEFAAPEQVLAGTTAMAANIIRPGEVRFAGRGETVIGQLDGRLKNAAGVAALFRKAGLDARATKNLQGALWTKAVLNAGINPLTALLRVKNGALLRFPETRLLMAEAVREAAGIARAGGIKLLCQNPAARVQEVASATADNLSSMLQDVLAGQRTEVGAINGAIAAEAEKMEMDAPVNRALTLLVKSLEKSYGRRLG